MSNRLVLTLAAALLMLPSTSLVSRAEESQTEEKQSACNKNCDSDCTNCKCENCDNPNCDTDNCTCASDEAGNTADCTKEKCSAGCDKKGAHSGITRTLAEWMSAPRKGDTCAEGDCRGGNGSYDQASCDADCSSTEAGCTKADCASGKRCKGKGCDATACSGKADCPSGKCCKGSACYASECSDELNFLNCDTLTLTGPSGFTVAQPSPASGVSEELWQQIARELSGDSKPVRRVTFVTANPDEESRGEQATENGPTQIQYSIQVVEDCQDCMSEYDDLRRGATVMFAESKTLLPAMRMLHKHQAVRQVSSPKIICMCGQKAQLDIADTPDHKRVQLEVASEKTENGLSVQLAMHTKCEAQSFEVKTSLLVEPGQTIVLNATPLPSKQSDGKPGETRAVYLMLTPEVVE